jgi:phosphoadenosine phosphosulfate reductase
MTLRLKLNLRVYRAALSPAWQEARDGKLWEHGVDGIGRYNQVNKVEPMQRAIRELGIRGWITGLRRQQAKSRSDVGVLQMQNGVVKIQPIIDWTDRQVFEYLKKHDLPYHPLREQGYLSIGDVHTSRPVSADMTEEESRFFGLKRECGLHIGENI